MLLSAETRKRILKLPFAREVCNMEVNITNKLFYNKINRAKHYDEKIRSLKKSKEGRCFIVGSGPSLTVDQLNHLAEEDSFGANRIYKMFPMTEWRPNYYIIQDPYDVTKGVYDNLDVDYLFVSDHYWKNHTLDNPNAVCYHIHRELHQTDNLPFSEEIDKWVSMGATITFSMIQMAVYLGYQELILIGMDHTYAQETNDKGEIVKRNNVRDHAFVDEKPKEVVANVAYMEAAYSTAKRYCDEHNVKILNATIGGKLEIFDRVEFYSLF